MLMRSAGILMPITALPSPYGIGTLGACARDFVRFLKRGGQTYWQILPIGPTSYGDSPYQSFSSFAGNPYLIDLDDLCEEGLLEKAEYADLFWGSDAQRIDYALLYQQRFKVLQHAVDRLPLNEETEAFYHAEAYWLDDYALFMALKDYYGGNTWHAWPESLQKRQPDAMQHARQTLAPQIRFWKGVQYLFFHQWKRFKAYANAHNIRIIGDLPIYVAGDSADVWANPEQFQLDEQLRPVEVAGCPPDGFSADGQLWGNPLFNWDLMKNQGYTWWLQRIRYQLEIFDVLRIDHFRGFDAYYSIPAGDDTARNGQWRTGPGIGFFRAVEQALGKVNIIAEDLGFLTPSVYQLLKDTGFPGMKVLEFAFDTRDTGSGYLPHCYTPHCVAYTGTHDNDTIVGWIKTAPQEDVQRAKDYLRLSEQEGYHWGMMRCAWASVADLAIMQLQDLNGLGSEARINTPSTVGNNWVWRCLPYNYSDAMADRLHHEMEVYDRLNPSNT